MPHLQVRQGLHPRGEAFPERHLKERSDRAGFQSVRVHLEMHLARRANLEALGSGGSRNRKNLLRSDKQRRRQLPVEDKFSDLPATTLSTRVSVWAAIAEVEKNAQS